jgi:hypothetical protein
VHSSRHVKLLECLAPVWQHLPRLELLHRFASISRTVPIGRLTVQRLHRALFRVPLCAVVVHFLLVEQRSKPCLCTLVNQCSSITPPYPIVMATAGMNRMNLMPAQHAMVTNLQHNCCIYQTYLKVISCLGVSFGDCVTCKEGYEINVYYADCSGDCDYVP